MGYSSRSHGNFVLLLYLEHWVLQADNLDLDHDKGAIYNIDGDEVLDSLSWTSSLIWFWPTSCFIYERDFPRFGIILYGNHIDKIKHIFILMSNANTKTFVYGATGFGG